MNWNQIESGWTKSYCANARKQWAKMSQEQLAATEGKQELLVGKVQEVYGISKQESEKQVSEWQERQLAAAPKAAAKFPGK